MNRYWKKKLKNEYGVYIKTVRIMDDYKLHRFYVAYKKIIDYRGYRNVVLLTTGLFDDPRDIYRYLLSLEENPYLKETEEELQNE